MEVTKYSRIHREHPTVPLGSKFRDSIVRGRTQQCLKVTPLICQPVDRPRRRIDELPNLLLDPFFKEKILQAQEAWRRVTATALTNGVPIPALTSALCYFDGYRTERLPAHLLQAQRDYFGAHTYERLDEPRGEFFHTNWTGRGGDTASTTYNI